MKIHIVGIGGLALALVALAAASGCAAMPANSVPATQAWSQTSAVTSAVAAAVGAAAPMPWGQIIAAILGAISVIAGVVAHGAVSNSSTQQTVSAVTAGLQAASQTVTPGNAGSSPPAK